MFCNKALRLCIQPNKHDIGAAIPQEISLSIDAPTAAQLTWSAQPHSPAHPTLSSTVH